MPAKKNQNKSLDGYSASFGLSINHFSILPILILCLLGFYLTQHPQSGLAVSLNNSNPYEIRKVSIPPSLHGVRLYLFLSGES